MDINITTNNERYAVIAHSGDAAKFLRECENMCINGWVPLGGAQMVLISPAEPTFLQTFTKSDEVKVVDCKDQVYFIEMYKQQLRDGNRPEEILQRNGAIVRDFLLRYEKYKSVK